ncbi:MAG: WD40/YVTN/BNR-like repeat-containing protein [Myxococcales bacterium]
MIAILLLSLFSELQWRPIGPIRGGRTKAASGVPQRPGTFYIGAVDGGVFATSDYGRTWTPIFDDQPTGSIGAIAVAPSNPDVIYVGSGEGLQRPDLSVGDGIYKSVDAGKTWRHLGLRDGQQIPQIAVDSRDPSRLFVAVLGHPYGPNEERGIFRSTDGGETFQRVLYKDADTGGADVVIDPANPAVVYASLWEARQAPWENGEFSGPGSGLFKSTDGGTTWKQLAKGLPDHEHDGLGRIGIGLAPSRTSRVFATVQTKKGGFLYRSDDGGESWTRICDDARVAERADDFAEVKVDPQDPDVVLTASVVVWRSTDGGKTFVAFRGAPGGDDYHRIWIDPVRPSTILIASDQGAIVTVNGGASWSSWYNQPTAQMFHVTADNAFPYRLCGGQQESGSACVSSRGADGAITFRDWHPAGVEEYGYAAPDPLDPDLVYGGKITRWDRRTGDQQEVSPAPVRRPDYRVVRTQPVLFSPTDPHTLYFASNVVWKTVDGGRRWTKISPDLTRAKWDDPPNVGKYRGTDDAKPSQRGVVYALAPSPIDPKTIWAGTDDGLIHVTHDGGKTWREVTPRQLVPWAKVSILEAGHSDARTAYAAIDTMRLDEMRPHLLRTHDGGKTWKEISDGLPPGGIARVVREDPRRPGLLFCGTEQSVYVSFDDGDQWQPLRLNMPSTSIRDLIVKDDDLAVATHGRGFWILDDIEPLREITDSIASEEAHLFRPRTALRVRWNTNTDTPLPPDEPASPNPPDGAVIDYLVKTPGEVTLEIVDPAGKILRKYSSADKIEPLRDDGNVPRWWIRPPPKLSGEPGLHRFVWDLHWGNAPHVLEGGYPIAAIPGNTPKEPRGPWAVPGKYAVRLTAAGKTLTQPLLVKIDPRVKTPAAALAQQLALSQRLAAALDEDFDALTKVREARKQHPDDKRLEELEGSAEPRRPGEKREEKPALAPWNGRLAALYDLLQSSDAAPTPQAAAAAEKVLAETAALVKSTAAALHLR